MRICLLFVVFRVKIRTTVKQEGIQMPKVIEDEVLQMAVRITNRHNKIHKREKGAWT